MEPARPVERGESWALDEGTRRSMVANRGRDTNPEVLLRSALHRAGLRYRKHRRPLASLRCEADVVFPSERVAVFLDGCFWHGCPDHGSSPAANGEWWRRKLQGNQDRDRRNDATLRAAGWQVVRVWEHEAPATAVERIRAVLDDRRGVCHF